eukprot:scaffold2849_cov593-Pavlova_lutheri.AAC.1
MIHPFTDRPSGSDTSESVYLRADGDAFRGRRRMQPTTLCNVLTWHYITSPELDRLVPCTIACCCTDASF